MESTQHANSDQAQHWNGHGGRSWVELQDLLDRMFKPFEEMLVKAIVAHGSTRVLDVGCGTGSTTLALAQAMAPSGRAVGIDISEPMLTVARSTAALTRWPATYIQGDAQAYAFAAHDFDMIVSRFGVMFFDDPVRAFGNLRQATRPGAALQAFAWRSVDENPFMAVPERAAAALLPALPPRKAGAPGQFAFADAGWIRTILEDSGWHDIDIRPVDVSCTMPEADLMPYASRLGPVGRMLQQADESLRLQVLKSVRASFEPYMRGGEARFNAACWLIGARS